MELNSLIFPAPPATYTAKNLDGLIYVPNYVESSPESKASSFQIPFFCFSPCSARKQAKNVERWIPCLNLRYNEGSTKLLLYFHGNAEDLGYAHEFLHNLKMELKVHILAVEYPGYGIYEGSPNADRIKEDAQVVYDYIINELQWPEKDIILLGRSMGSGPSCHIAARNSPGGLVLISPYTSIRHVVRAMLGPVLQYLVEDRFNNIEEIKNVTCPSFFIHGEDDELIPYQQSIDLMGNCKGTTEISIRKEMSHNGYNIFFDIINPIREFLKKQSLSPSDIPLRERSEAFLKLPPYVFTKIRTAPSTPLAYSG